MRLTPEQVKQGILHPARDVRDAAVYYFVDCFSTDRDLMPLAIQAIEKYGWSEAFSVYRFLQNLRHTDETLRWVIDRLGQRGQPGNEKEDDLVSWLLDAVLNAAPDLIRAHKDRIIGLDVVEEEVQETIEERLLLHGFTPEELWRELEEFCEENKTEEYLTDQDIDFAHRLVEAMGGHPAVFDARVLGLLAQDIEDYTDHPMKWMEPCLVRLAGEL